MVAVAVSRRREDVPPIKMGPRQKQYNHYDVVREMEASHVVSARHGDVTREMEASHAVSARHGDVTREMETSHALIILFRSCPISAYGVESEIGEDRYKMHAKLDVRTIRCTYN